MAYGCRTRACNPTVAAARIAIHGAGSVGCFIGGAWQAKGLPVTYIGRPKLARHICSNGLTVSDYGGWQAHFDDVDYRIAPEALGEADIIALCVKSGSTAEAVREISEHVGDRALDRAGDRGRCGLDNVQRQQQKR